MCAAVAQSLKLHTLSPDMRFSVQKTQRYLRHTFRKVLAEPIHAEVSEQALYIEDPHIYATWSSQSCLLGAGFKIGARIQFDSSDARNLQNLHGQSSIDTLDDEVVIRRMQESTDLITEHLQRNCQAAGLITGISQASVSKAFCKTQGPSYQLRGGAIDSWLLRVQDSVFYCTTHIIFDESRDIVILGQSLPT